jgi:hypothetical protein
MYGFASPCGLETGLMRFGGVGLGNLLFSWARCSVFCKASGATQLYTTWPQFKPGSWIRWESDKRHYRGLFRPLPDELHGAAKLRLLYTLPRVSENEWDAKTKEPQQVVVHRGLRNYFLDIPAHEYIWLKERFFSALRDRQVFEGKTKPHIGVHIRMGDKPAYGSQTGSTTNMQLPISWYAHVIQSISAELNWTGEIGVCSDASEDQLRPVLQLRNVRLVRGRTAIEDLMYLAKSSLLVGSFSTFSQWAAYLSGRASIWHPEYDRKGGLGNGSFEMLMSQDLPPNRIAWKRCMELAFDLPACAGSSLSSL